MATAMPPSVSASTVALRAMADKSASQARQSSHHRSTPYISVRSQPDRQLRRPAITYRPVGASAQKVYTRRAPGITSLLPISDGAILPDRTVGR